MAKNRLLLGLLVALMLVGGAWHPALAETTQLSIGTAGTAGGLYAYGGAIAAVVSKHAPGLSVTAESTGGSVENLKLLDKHELPMAEVGNDVLHQAFYDYKNSKRFDHKIEVRALFNMYTQPTHIVTLAGSDIKTIYDIKGKRVGVGSPGSGTEVKSRAILKALGITYQDFTPEFLSFSEAAEALQDKTIVAEFLGSPVPNASVESLALTNGIRLVSLSDSDIATIVKAYPYMKKTVIPGGVYKGVDKNTGAVAVQTVFVCRPDLPEDEVYKFVKAVFENKDELNVIHPSLRETTLENATPTSIPLHPGAMKYFKEMGVYKQYQE